MHTIKLTSRDLAKLRRIALSHQGLTQRKPFGAGKNGAEAAIRRLGYVQIDTISVVQRAHHHVLHSRVPDYQPAHLDKLLLERKVFEYWAHAAAFLPIDAYRYTLPYKQSIKSGKRHWYKNPDYALMKKLLARIEQDGPLQSKDIEGGKRKSGGWWDWKPGKRALEQLYFQGDVMVTERNGFQKAYDLPERVLPADVDTSMPGFSEYACYLLDQQLACHGFLTLKGITYQRRDEGLRRATKKELEHRLQRGTLVALKGRDTQTYFAPAELLEQTAPRAPAQARILSPFDNCLIQRDRVADLFGFDYQIECYVPAAQRKYGYFCLPILFRDGFVGRLDCKTHRDKALLEIKSIHIEQDKELDTMLVALREAVGEFARFQGADRITVGQVYPQHLSRQTQRLLSVE